MHRKFGLDDVGADAEYKSSEPDDHSGSDKDYSAVSSKIKKLLKQQNDNTPTPMVRHMSVGMHVVC
jgi:hypothetical protein